MSPHLKSLTAVSLAVLYSVVGLCGETLHYLVEDISLAATQVQVDQTCGYFHSHQPDNHVHFHHHHHHGSKAQNRGDARMAKAAKPERKQNKSGTRSNERFHYPHACPLLTVVSQLKLGHGVFAPLVVDVEATHASLSEFNLGHVFEFLSISHARGPPSNTWLA